MAPKNMNKKDKGKEREKTPERAQRTTVPQTPGLSQGVSNLSVQDPVTPVPKEQHLAQDSQALVRFRDAAVALVPNSPEWRNSFEQLIHDLTLKAPREQRHTLDAWITRTSAALDSAYDLIMEVGHYCENNTALMDEYGGVQDFRTYYPIFKEVKDTKDKRRSEMIAAVKSIKEKELGLIEECITPSMPKLLLTHTAMVDMSFVLKRMDVLNASLFLNQLALERIATPGRSNDKFVNAQDWAHLKAFCKDLCKFANDNIFPSDEDPPDVTIDRCSELEAMLYDADLGPDDLAYSPQKLRPDLRSYYKAKEFWEEVFEDVACSIQIPGTNRYCTTHGEGDDSHNAGLNKEGMIRHPKFGLAITKTTYVPPIENGQENLVPARNMDLELQNIGARTRRARTQSVASAEERIDLERDAGTEVVRRRVAVINNMITEASAIVPTLYLPTPRQSSRAPRATNAYRRAANALDTSIAEEDEEDDEEVPDTREEQAAVVAATCLCKDNQSRLLGLVRKLYPIKATVKDPSRFQLIEEWYREVVVVKKDDNIEPHYNKVCYVHRASIASIMGVYRRAMDTAALDRMLTLLYLYRYRWDYMRSHREGSTLFLKKHRGFQLDDDMLSYRYRPTALPAPTIDWAKFRKKMTVLGMEKIYNNFKTGGTVTVGLFDYLVKDPEISTIIDKSFNMYRYHLREIDGRPNLGWLRNMYHSLIQQAVRTDLGYWLCYAVLRGEHTLISYPYYAKYTVPGDMTYFRHVDCNLEWAHRDGLGSQMIQGSVSLDNEDKKNCTEVLYGFHRIIPQYLQWRKESGSRESSGLIEAWDDKDH